MRIEIQSNAAAVLAQVKGFSPRMQQGIAGALNRQNELSIGYAQSKKLSGPRPQLLGVVTNRLRGSLTRIPATVQESVVDSAIGTNVKYARAHEKGFDGMVTVRGFIRKNPRGDTYGSATSEFNPETGKVTKRKAKRTSQGISTVRSFRRHMKMPARPFLSTTLQERTPDYSAATSEAIVVAWNGGRP